VQELAQAAAEFAITDLAAASKLMRYHA